MVRKIDMYYDCVSPYSFFAFHRIMQNREALMSHDVVLELHPVLQGGVMQGSGNKPPFSVPAKALYGTFDRNRAMKYFGLDIIVPSFFPMKSQLPQRCLTYIKDKYSPEVLEKASLECWKMAWQEETDLSEPERMQECLARNFPAAEVELIMTASTTPEVKSKLKATTEEVLEAGAFGSPWFMVTNDKGEKEPFFGSDRFHHIWDFLGLPWTDIQLRPKSRI